MNNGIPPMRKSRVVAPLLGSIALLGTVHAAEINKLQNTDALTLGSSWSGGTVPGSGDIMLWSSMYTTPGTAATLSQLGGDLSVLGLKVTNVGGALNAGNTMVGFQNTSSANTLTIGAGGIDLSAGTQALLLQSRILIGANQTWNVPNVNTGNTASSFNDGEDLTFQAQAGNTTTAGTPFDLGANTVTKVGAGTTLVTSGYLVSNGTFNVNEGTLFLGGGNSRLLTIASSVNMNLAAGGTVLLQSNSAGVTSNATINLNGGTLRLVPNNATQPVTVNGSVAVNTPSTIAVAATVTNGGVDGPVLLNATLTGSAALSLTNTANAVGRFLRLAGDNSGYTGTVTLGGTAGRVTRITSPTGGSSAATWSISAGHTLQLDGVSATLGTLSGTGTLSTAAASTSTATVNAGTFDGVLTNGVGILALTKAGPGTLTLTGANSYTGPTIVTSGTLIATPAQAAVTDVTVADGATFGVRLSSAGTTLSLPSITAGTSTGANLSFDIGALGNPIAPLLSVNTLTPTAPLTLRLLGTLAPTSGTPFPLLSYTGGIGGLGFGGLSLALPFRVNGSLVNDTANSRIGVTITGVSTPRWRGNVNGNWDVDNVGDGSVGTRNWSASSGPNTYVQGTVGTDSVIFDDTATGTTTVNLSTALAPIAVAVNNAALNYTWSGSGKLGGTMSLVKSGPGSLRIANSAANDFTGGTIINDGTVFLGDGTTAGAGTLGSGAVTVTTPGILVLDRPDTFTLANALGGSGTLRKKNANTVTLAAVVNDVGVELTGGTLAFGAGGLLGGSVSGTGALAVTGGTLQLTGTTANTNTGLTTVSAGTLQLNKLSGNNAIGGDLLLTGTGGLVLSQPDQLANTATVTYDKTGINQGTVTIANETIAALNVLNGNDTGSQLVVNNGTFITGTLKVANSAVFAVASGHSAAAGSLDVSGSSIVRIAANSGPSTLDIGAGGIVASGGTIQVGHGTGANNAVLNLGGDLLATGNLSFTDGGYSGPQLREINLGSANRTFNIGAGTTTAVAPDIAGAGGLVKTGEGTLQLNATSFSTFTGPTTIGAGTLLLQGSLNGTAALDVAGVLAGSGSIAPAAGGNVRLLQGGKLSPGSGPGTLNFAFTGGGGLDLTGAISPANSQALLFDLDSISLSDLVAVLGGPLNIGTGVLDFNDFAFSAGPSFGPGTYTLFHGDSPFAGTLGTALTGSVAGFQATVAMNGNDLVLAVIPEPQTWTAVALGLGGLLGFRRRTRRRHS